MTMRWIPLVLPLALACGGQSSSSVDCSSAPKTTYNREVKALLDGHCISCHASSQSGSSRNGAPGSVNLDTYAASKTRASDAADEVEAGSMPPASRNDQLSDTERCILRGWVNNGLAE